MNEVHKNEIVYEEGWREAKAQEADEPTPIDEITESEKEKPEAGSKPLLITIQLVVCLLLMLILFLLKTMDSESYRGFMEFYGEELDKPLVSQGVFSSLDLGRLFNGAEVTVEATPDEG